MAAWSSLGPRVMTGDPAVMRLATGDAAVALAGFRYYLADGWHLPLLFTAKLDAPRGTVIAYTDSIPLLALTAKSVRALGIPAERWWGWWLTAGFVGQATAALFALRAWRVRSAIVGLATATVLVMFPPFLFRVFHPALAFQAPLIVAIGLAGLLRRPDSRLAVPATVVLPVVALLIHPYHLLACLVILAGGHLDAARLGRRPVRVVIGWAVATAGLTGGVALIGGYFSQSVVPAEGYGTYALIPWSPLWPQLSWWWPGHDDILLASHTSEGFAFVGVGGLVLVAAGIVLAVRRFPNTWRAVGSLAVGLILLGLYAVTPRIHVGPDTVVDVGHHLSAMARLTGTFRASGRLAWSLDYAAILGSVVLLARRLDRRWVAVLVVGAALIQMVDQQDLRRFDHTVYAYDAERSDRLDALIELVSLHQEVALVPDFACTAYPDGLEQFMEVIVAASLADVSIDNSYAARRALPACPTVESLTPTDSTLVISAQPGLLDTTGLDCRQWASEIIACSTRWAELDPGARTRFS